MLKSQVVLGFDVGSHKIGVAVGQTLTKSAKALQKIPAKNGLPQAGDIKKLIASWKPKALIVGIPTHLDGKHQFTTRLALKFVDYLKELVQLPVYTVDERLTTKSARSELFEQGGFRHLEKSDVDSYAAKIIVESWLAESMLMPKDS